MSVTVSVVSVVLLYVCVDYNIVLCNIDDFLLSVNTAQGLLMNFGMKCLLLHNMRNESAKRHWMRYPLHMRV